MSDQPLYVKRKSIHPKQIWGASHKWRIICGSLMYGMFFLIPWISWGDRPAVYFDLDLRQFHILNTTFWPQDFMFLAWFLIIAAFGLFLFTNVAGRLWCGFTCPQTVWTFIFILVEEWTEGSAHKRRKLEHQKMTPERLARKIVKHAIWIIIAVITGLTFVAYFYPIQTLLIDIWNFDISLGALFWVGVFTWLTYVDAGLLREQVCIYMCPYARFQSVMYDEDTLAVGYHSGHGEPRLSKSKSDYEQSGKSQCIDCNICVQVCPTGIDIRDGMQLDCINCGLCVDACGDVMESIGRPKDLINFTTQNKLKGLKSRIFRPRSIGYFSVFIIMCTLFSTQLMNRSEIEASILKNRDRLYQMTKRGTVLNYYTFKLANKSQNSHNYQVTIKPEGFTIRKSATISLSKGESMETFLVVESQLKGEHEDTHGSQIITFEINAVDGSSSAQVESRFIFP